jgi:peptidoglycan/xylan/chitin deacetylase (PgdA/CDA1 family)
MPGIPTTHDRQVARVAGLGLAGALGYWLPATAVISAAARRAFGVRATIARDDAVALTFDDGPHEQGTPAVLAALAAAGAPATFFLAGEQVERMPGLAAEIVAAGHEIGVHCRRHRNSLRLTPRQVRDDLLRAADTIAGATGRIPRYYRPPYGILTAGCLAVARRAGWETILWRRDGHDWQARATAASISARILRRLAPGDVVLLHDADHYSSADSWRATAAAIPLLVAGLRDRGLGIGPLDAAEEEEASRGRPVGDGRPRR